MQGYARPVLMDFTWLNQQEHAMLVPMVLSHAHFLRFNSASQGTISSIPPVSTAYQIAWHAQMLTLAPNVDKVTS